ncbi:potassium channel family protein [Mycoplasmopsis columbinasalis]|uniref:Voltage-gated potassium channel n=1 Tax=Mycoplasmopsis columbinasalis TaxID=114880 RepID=A0A449B9N8_9BACT|nr:potassium channel family protein [Mycoplasmopsis columbinasalis]VEU77875.1 voltage-gated potassium channel [Mycoplasmopsis columbinasalis]
MSEVKEARKRKHRQRFWETLREIGIIVTSDSELNIRKKKHAIFIKMARNIYAVFVTFFIIFSFTSFLLLKQDIRSAASIKIAIAIELTTFLVFLSDFVIRWITFPTRDSKYKGSYFKSFLRFLLTASCWICFLSILPSLVVVNLWLGPTTKIRFIEILGNLKVIRFLRFFLLLNMFAIFKSSAKLLKDQKHIIFYSILFVIIFVALVALTIYYTENNFATNNYGKLGYASVDEFYNDHQNIVQDYWDSLYFTSITLTTIGYGDFAPYSAAAKIIVPIISILGIAIIAAPGGIFAGALMTVIQANKKKKKTKAEQKLDQDREFKLKTHEISKQIEDLINARVTELVNEKMSELSERID